MISIIHTQFQHNTTHIFSFFQTLAYSAGVLTLSVNLSSVRLPQLELFYKSEKNNNFKKIKNPTTKFLSLIILIKQYVIRRDFISSFHFVIRSLSVFQSDFKQD